MDLLSRLPDELICHILSFLPTKYSAQTSVLSKRWKLLWTHVPLLEFVFKYLEFVDSKTITNILLQCKHDIHTFLMCGGGDFGDRGEEFESLIAEVTTRNIRNLVINISYNFSLPQCLFTSETLVYMSLLCLADFPTSGIYLPALKKLKLVCVEYLFHESLDCLVSGCPVLEELSIEGIVWDHLCVSSPILTSLVLEIYNFKHSDFGVKLDTPRLRYLRLHCSMPDIFSVGALDSLIVADIDLSWDEMHLDNFVYWSNVLALVGKLCNVKLLTLSTHQMTVNHDMSFFALPIKFQNLTKLHLHSNLGFTTGFLESASNLRVIKLIDIKDDTNNQYCWTDPKRVPECLISHLQTVVCYFGCSKHEYDMLRYILMNAKVLKRMEVLTQPHHDSKKKSEALNTIALFERGSQDCQLLFH